MTSYFKPLLSEVIGHSLEVARNLTPRETEVLRLILDGQSNKEAARILSISPRTVEVHRGHLMGKLGVKNAVHLTRVMAEVDHQLQKERDA